MYGTAYTPRHPSPCGIPVIDGWETVHIILSLATRCQAVCTLYHPSSQTSNLYSLISDMQPRKEDKLSNQPSTPFIPGAEKKQQESSCVCTYWVRYNITITGTEIVIRVQRASPNSHNTLVDRLKMQSSWPSHGRTWTRSLLIIDGGQASSLIIRSSEVSFVVWYYVTRNTQWDFDEVVMYKRASCCELHLN